ncbi:hypothetical protein PQI07_28060 [Methylobacterium sp. 092160098-2]|uniref:hypothetical protein n=1 Tax=Methylobacterium sp. 092160098-2 TaxID=3025129 RepID=UPI002381BDA1|nr:hypothetical protein [Methylobacterium sp. 092160098-2]MDE4914524.1 hypothetical protein [Methylobacterium sp. 092160098-2]
MAKARIGRPLGSGLNDEPTLRLVDDLLHSDPTLSLRAAIVQSEVVDEASIRRLQRKYRQRERERSGDVAALLAKPFEIGEIAIGEDGWVQVEIPCADGDVFRVTHMSRYQSPALHISSGKNPLNVCWSPQRHPLAVAIRSLPAKYDWDDPTYRACCNRVGLDPDHERPQHIYATRVAGCDALAELANKDRIARGDTALEGLERPELGAENRDPLWDVVDDGYAFLEYAPGSFCAESLARLYLKHADRLEPASIQAAKDALHAFCSGDWWGTSERRTVAFIASPTGPNREYGPVWFDEPDVGLDRHGPNLAPAPARNNLIERHILRSVERNSTTLVLSEEELKNYEAGGDRAHWDRYNRIKASRLKVLWNALRAPDLSMTAAIAEETIRVSYAGYLARCHGIALDPLSKLSFESRAPIQPSKPRRILQNIKGNLRFVWNALAPAPSPAGTEYSYANGCRVFLGKGSCLLIDDYDRVRIISEEHPFNYKGRNVQLNIDLRPWGALGFIPDIGARSFEMIDPETGEPLEPDLALPILRSAVEACLQRSIIQRFETFVGRLVVRLLLAVVVVLAYLLLAG